MVVLLLLVLRAAEEVDGCTFQRDKAGMVTAERRCAAIVRFVAVRSYSVHALGVVSLKSSHYSQHCHCHWRIALSPWRPTHGEHSCQQQAAAPASAGGPSGYRRAAP